MDPKRVKYSPATFKNMEKNYLDDLVSGRLAALVPDTYKGKKPTNWEELHRHFPAPSSVQLQADQRAFERKMRTQLRLNRFTCACDNCQEATNTEISYFHSVMDDIDNQLTPIPVRYPVVPTNMVVQYDMNAAFGMVIHAVHVYDGYAIENGSADECPLTPRFTSIDMRKTNAECVEFERKEQEKWIHRMGMTPTRLVFKN